MSYRSKSKLFGLPLVDVASGSQDGRRGVAKGWIAIGDIAFGVVFSMGGVAFGGIAVGGLSLGLIAIAGLALGGMALGGGAIGGMATGGLAIGAYSADGGAAIAYQYAHGGLAIARHANDDAAEHFMNHSPHVVGQFLIRLFGEFGPFIAILPGVLLLLRSKRRRQAGSDRPS